MGINNTIRKFLRHPAPHPDESISGYLIRLAESNGYDFSDVWSLFGFDKESSQNKQPLAYVYGCADYSILSRRTGFSEESLKSLAYHPIQVNPQQFVGTYELFANKLGSQMLQYRISTLCPGCLTESAYQRKIWDLLSLTACPIHKCLLIDRCPQCDKPIHYRRDRMCFCSCGNDFRTIETTLVSGKELGLARRIYELCGLLPNAYIGTTKTNEKMPDVLMALDLSSLLQAVFLVSSQTSNGDVWGQYLASLAMSERHLALTSALDAYENFPVNFFEFLTSLKDVFRHRTKVLDPKRIGKQRSAVYHGVTRLLDKLMAGQQFEFLRHAFREFLHREKLASYRIDLDYTKTTAEDFLASHVTLQESARLLKKTKKSSKSMIENKALRTRKGTMPNGLDVYYVDLKDINRVKERLARVISAVEAARSIGLYIYQMNQLIEAGIFEVIKDIKIKPINCRIVDKQQVTDFYHSFGKAMRNNPAYKKSSKNISSRAAFAALGNHQISFSDLARMVLNGKIAPAGCDEKMGINGFVYEEKQIQKLVEEKRKEIVKDTLSSEEAAKIIGIKVEVFRNLVRKNYLSFTNTKPVSGRRFSREAIGGFCRDFVFSNEIAGKFSTSNEYANRKLAEENICPADDELDRYNYLYRREEVGNTVIKKVNPAERTNKIRREKLRSLPEAARRLGLSEDELKLALERKLICFCRGRYRQDMMFSEKSISSFEKINLPHVNFLRETEAIKMVKVGVRSFKKYLNEGLITPEVRSYQKKSTNRFYSIEDLEALRIKLKDKK